MSSRLVTSESVTEGHPDKTADQISDALVDKYIDIDGFSHVAIETLVTTDFCLVAGEVASEYSLQDPEGIVRSVVRDIGYRDGINDGFDADTFRFENMIHEQSNDIRNAVGRGEESAVLGAGDQGMVYGHACNETEELMPMPIAIAHRLTKRMAAARKSGEVPWMRPDGKSQVTVQYVDGKPMRVHTVVASSQHQDIDPERIRREMIGAVVVPVCRGLMDSDTIIHVNPSGRFVIGGPSGDTGLTGRKIIVDTYGGVGRHGGGSFCLAGNSLVNTEKGMLPIAECAEIGERGLLVKTDVHPMPAGAWYDNGIKPTELVVTEDGYAVEATLNHNVRTINSNGDYVWKPIESLKIGDWIAIQTKNRFFGKDEIPKFLYNYKKGTAERRKKKYTFPTKLTREYAYLLGLLIGDGDCTDEGCIKICVCENEMKKNVENLFEILFSNKGRLYGHWAYLGGVELRAYLKHLGLSFAKSFEKSVPNSIFNASKENCAAFLRGLFDTDGSVGIDGRNKTTIRVHLATTSKKLAEEVQLLLLNFGIISKITSVRVQNKQSYIKGRKIISKHVRYDLTVKGGKSIEIFRNYIGFNLSRKQNILNMNFGKKRNLYKIPFQRQKISKLFKKLPLEEQRKDTCKIGRFTRFSKGKATKELTYEKLKEFVKVYELFFKNDPDFIILQNLFFMEHYYSKIKMKIPSFAHTYDLNVPFSHTFTANGIVCHNSGKDPTKVDRSGAYMARHIAKNIVAAGFADVCEIQLAYAIGLADPVSIYVDTFGTGNCDGTKFDDEVLANAVRELFPLTPAGIIGYLNLREPIYRQTAAYGHFGRDEPGFTWERTNRVENLRQYFGLSRDIRELGSCSD